jgi:hypothetical protein
MPANNDTLLKDVDVQGVSMVVGVRREDKSLYVGALLGKPFTSEALAQAQAKPRPNPSPPNGPGLMFFQAQALESQAKAMAFRPGRARCITSSVANLNLHDDQI